MTEVEESFDITQDAFLEAAITLNRNRIFCRLRSCHAKLHCNFKKDKQRRPKIASQLSDAMARISMANKPTDTNMETLVANVRTFQDLSDQLDSLSYSDAQAYAGAKLILSITKTAYQMSRQDILGHTLSRLSKLDPNTIRNISAVVMKLGRYVSSSLNLLRAAREYSVFVSIEVQIIKISPPPRLSYKDSDSIIDRLSDRFAKKHGRDEIISCLQAPNSASKAKGSVGIESDLQQLATLDCAVHAEIQILFHYAVNQPLTYPRVICSTKKACYLCNLFFKLDGRFFIPSSHGRLYEKWVIPELTTPLSRDRMERMSSVINQFITAIEDKISHIIATGKKAYPSPLESIFFRSAIWFGPAQSRRTSTISLIPAIKRAIESPRTMPPNIIREASKASASETVIQGSKPLQALDQDYNSPVHSSASVHAYAVLSPTSSGKGPVTYFTPSRSNACYHLQRGISIQIDLLAWDRQVRVETRRIHLTLSYQKISPLVSAASREQAGESNPIGETGERFLVLLKWLEPEEQARVFSEKALNLVDLDSFGGGSEAIFDQYNGEFLTGLYLFRGADMIFIKCWNE
jgi:hypothetical protein